MTRRAARWVLVCSLALGSGCESASSVVLDGDPECVAYYSGSAPLDAGGPCTTNADCLASTYCSAASCDGPGTCQPRCDGTTSGGGLSLSCGCDGKVYASPNAVARAGLRAAQPSTCGVPFFETEAPEGGLSDCSSDADCPTGFGCSVDCTTNAGLCVAQLTAAQCADDVAPICGCDGVVYQNSCRLVAAHASPASFRTPPNCGG